jgi:hypothetical protein
VSASNETKTDRQCVLDMVKRRYENRLTSEEIEELHKAIDGVLDMADALRLVKLKNSDEPFTLFIPYRMED